MRANFLVLVFSCTLFFAAAEVGIRLFFPTTPAKSTSLRPDLYYLGTSPAYMRDFSYPKQKPKDTFRIVVVGDSLSYPWKIQFYDTFSKRLEWMLNLNDDKERVEVLNFGVSGKATENHFWTIQRVLKNWEPDFILLQNTLNDPDKTPYQQRFKRKIQRWKKIENNFLVNNSALISLIAASIKKRIMKRDLHRYLHALFFSERSWSHWSFLVQKIKSQCENAKVSCGAVTFPMFGFPERGSQSLEAIYMRINDLFRSLEFQHLDLSGSYAGLGQELLMVEPGVDSHPNEIAHRIAAEAIAKWLLTEHLIPRQHAPLYASPAYEPAPPMQIMIDNNPSAGSAYILKRK